MEPIENIISEAKKKASASEAIDAAEALAEYYPCTVTMKDIAPVYVPEGYELFTDNEFIAPHHDRATKTFPNGSVVNLSLLLF